MPDQGEQQGDPDAELEGAGVVDEVGVSGELAVSANQLGVSSAATPAAVMNSPASRVTARTKRRPRSIAGAGDHPSVGLMVVWPWVLMALAPREGR
jgi:hypothetical protein